MSAAPLKSADWTILAFLGAPISPGAPSKLKVTATGDLLVSHLLTALQELNRTPQTQDSSRKRECLQALILAVQAHFPRFFKSHLVDIPGLRDFLPVEITGRLLKLKRLALSRVCEYL